MPSPAACAKKHKKGTKAYKDCISYKGKYSKSSKSPSGRKGNGTGKRMSY